MKLRCIKRSSQRKAGYFEINYEFMMIQPDFCSKEIRNEVKIMLSDQTSIMTVKLTVINSKWTHMYAYYIKKNIMNIIDKLMNCTNRLFYYYHNNCNM